MFRLFALSSADAVGAALGGEIEEMSKSSKFRIPDKVNNPNSVRGFRAKLSFLREL